MTEREPSPATGTRRTDDWREQTIPGIQPIPVVAGDTTPGYAPGPPPPGRRREPIHPAAAGGRDVLSTDSQRDEHQRQNEDGGEQNHQTTQRQPGGPHDHVCNEAD